LFSGRYRGVETLYHSGGWTGNNSQMLKVPAAALDIAIMVNREDVQASVLANRILDACIPGLENPGKRGGMPCVEGNYRSASSGRVVQLSARDGKQILSVDGMEMPAEPDAEGVLWSAELSACFKQGVILNGAPPRPSSVRLSDFGNLDDLTLLPPAAKPSVSAIAGGYCSAGTGTSAVICETADGPHLRTQGKFGSAEFRLECIGSGTWRARSTGLRAWYGGILSFESSSAGFRFSNYCTRALPFQRAD
jgi:hypothetical protein